MTNLGLCGAHRTGKTTLAKALSFALDMPFISINTSEIFAANHIDPASAMDFRTRLGIQRKILNHACLEWQIATSAFICDRTPIDMMAYTLAEVSGKTLDPFMESELSYYLDDCKKAVEKYFGCVVLIPPAIPIVDAIGKASPSKGYIDHIHLLCLGLLHNSHVIGYSIDEDVVNVEARVADVKRFWEQNK